MNDKERILMCILQNLYFTQGLCLNMAGGESKFKRTEGGEYVHFGEWDDRPIQKGDLVMGITGNISKWKIGWAHEIISQNEIVIREIGSSATCRWSNERFHRIVGMPEELLLESEQFAFREKVIKAFHKGNSYLYRFGGVDFLEADIAKIWIREAFGGIKNPSQPFSFEIQWNKKTTIKSILDAMSANGYGTKKFEASFPSVTNS